TDPEPDQPRLAGGEDLAPELVDRPFHATARHAAHRGAVRADEHRRPRRSRCALPRAHHGRHAHRLVVPPPGQQVLQYLVHLAPPPVVGDPARPASASSRSPSASRRWALTTASQYGQAAAMPPARVWKPGGALGGLAHTARYGSRDWRDICRPPTAGSPVSHPSETMSTTACGAMPRAP